MRTLKEKLPRYYYSNDYLETDLSSVMSSLNDDVRFNTDLALIKTD